MLLDLKASITGVQVNYYIICPTKLWLFSHFTKMEHNSDLVSKGKLLQESSFQQFRKDFVIDQRICIDFIKKGNRQIIHEIKKSSAMEKAHVTQLLYYLYYLKYEKGMKNLVGILNYPSERKIVEVELTFEKEAELKNILEEIAEVIYLPKPPKPKRKRCCRKCSYFEFCFS
ncbi:MAG: CRISPR-associated protein Cas4 [Candidatus Diapherotrites archaeon]